MPPTPVVPGNDVFAAVVRRAQQLQTRAQISKTDIWIFVVVVLGVLLLVTFVVFTTLYVVKRRRYARAAKEDPMHQQELSRRRRMSAADRAEAEELERTMMIQKSLASRSSVFTTPGHSPSASNASNIDTTQRSNLSNVMSSEGRDVGDIERGLREDWKDWEARTTEERRLSRLDDPSIQGHPAFSQEMQQVLLTRQSTASPTDGVVPESPSTQHSPGLHRTSAIRLSGSLRRTYAPLIHLRS